MTHRRAFFSRVASVLAATKLKAAGPAASVAAVQVPDSRKLPYKLVDGVKEFHLIAEVVETEFVPGRKVHAWGYNGSVPGPLLEANEGDRVRVIFENRLPEMTGLHWHGFEVPMEQDGSLGLGQDPTQPGGRQTYEFTLNQSGTFFYHSHFPMQEMMGMIGLFVLHPREAQSPRVDRDFGIVIQEWALLPNNTVPNTLAMEFNWLTFNGRSGPDCTPMLVKLGERVRIRMVNLGMDHHPIHLHGNTFYVTGTEAGRIDQSRWIPENTTIVGVAQARDIEFVAKNVGDWMLHCHLPHHMMNQMVPMVGHDVDRDSPHYHHFAHAVKQPGYPQDMWMKMDEFVRPKPENEGLRRGWPAAMMGMMTLVRVLPPDRFDAILKNTRGGQPA